MKLERAYDSPLDMFIGFLQSLADAFLGWMAGLYELLTDIPGAILDWLG